MVIKCFFKRKIRIIKWLLVFWLIHAANLARHTVIYLLLEWLLPAYAQNTRSTYLRWLSELMMMSSLGACSITFK